MYVCMYDMVWIMYVSVWCGIVQSILHPLTAHTCTRKRKIGKRGAVSAHAIGKKFLSRSLARSPLGCVAGDSLPQLYCAGLAAGRRCLLDADVLLVWMGAETNMSTLNAR